MDDAKRGKFWAFIAIGVVCFMIAPVGFFMAPILGEALLIVSGLSFVGAIVIRANGIRPKYDLERLREIHEKEELRAIEDMEPLDYDSFVCMGCGETYNMRLPVCPRCKLPQGMPPCR